MIVGQISSMAFIWQLLSVSLVSGVGSLELMLGHTFYNRPCLAIDMLVHTCKYIWLFEKCKV